MSKIKPQLEEFRPDIRLVDERGPTKERIGRADGHVETGETGTVTLRDCPLERALRKKIIGRDQYNAGIKFRLHWYHGGLAPGFGSLDLNRVFGGEVFSGPMPTTERQVFHQQSYRLACQHVGMGTSKILGDVICLEYPLAEVGKATLNMPVRQSAEIAVRALLVNGLDMLVELWGLRTK